MRRTVHLVVWCGLIGLAALGAGCHSAWVSSGLLYIEQNNYPKAEEMFKRALWYNDEEAAAHYHLAYTLAYRAEHDHMPIGEVDSARIKIAAAREHYLRAAELDPEKWKFNPDTEKEEERTPAEDGIRDMWVAMYNQGVISREAGKLDDALTYLDLALLADPTGKRGFDSQMLKATLRYNEAISNQGNPDLATLRDVVTNLEGVTVPESEDASQDRADLVKIKANIYRALGDDTKAAALYEELLAQNPDDLRLLQSVAQDRMSAGDTDGALELYQRAVQVAADNTSLGPEQKFEVTFRTTLALRDAERYPECVRMADRAMQYATTNDQRARAARAKAGSHLELEEYQEAANTIEPVVRDGGFDPNSVEGWQIYWRALRNLNRETEAMQALERFRALRDQPGR